MLSPARDEVAVSLVGMLLDANEKHYVGWFRDFSKGRPKTDVADAIRLIGHANHDLLAAVVGRGKKFSPPEYIRVYLDCRGGRRLGNLRQTSGFRFSM